MIKAFVWSIALNRIDANDLQKPPLMLRDYKYTNTLTII